MVQIKNDLLQAQRKEAVERLKMLSVHPNVIQDFEEGTLNVSELDGILYWLSDEDKEVVREFEERTGSVVYHVIKNHLVFGTCLSMLYVSDSPDEWEYDRSDLSVRSEFEDGVSGYIVMAYVANLDDDLCSEFGSIGVVPRIGGLRRIY